MNKTSKNKTAVLASLTVILPTLTLTGCSPSPHSGASSGGVTGGHRHVYAGLDTSVSYRSCLGVATTLCARQAMHLDPDQDHLTVYRLDSSTREFRDGRAPASADQFQQSLIAQVSAVSETRGTFPARFWNTVAKRSTGEAGSIVLELFSDGDNDDQTEPSRAEICRAAARLAANPHVVCVSIFGAAPRNWARLRAEFAPLGSRFHLCSPPDMTMDQVTAALEG